MKFKSTAIFFTLLMIFSAQAQKIKYKDLYPVLQAKNYEEGIPQLFQFLADPKNTEEPNANLQMGLWLEDRFLKYDVVYDSSKVYAVGDSAIFYFEKAKTLVTEKELKKRDEYYQAFFRRDLRTGEFGIKLSDVHLDIEKKVENIETRTAEVKELHRIVRSIAVDQEKAKSEYKKVVTQFSAYNAMLIGADESVQTTISSIEDFGSLALKNAETAHEMAVKLNADKYTESPTLKPIEEFGTDGLDETEMNMSITLWDYQSWARDAMSEIRGGVGLFKTMIKNYSDELRDKKSKVKKSQNVEIDEFPSDLAAQFDKYDPASTVEKLLTVEMHEAKIIKKVDLQINPALMDSALIGHQLAIYEQALEESKKMNVLVESITTDDLDESKKKYTDYIESFFQKYVTASKYVSDMQVWSRRQVEWLTNSVEFWTEKNQWGVDTEDVERNYPLFVQDIPENNMMTISVPVKSPEEVLIHTVDMEAEKGYVVSFGPDRFSKWKLEFDLPGTETVQYESDSIPSIAGSMSFYIQNTAIQENNFAVVSYKPTGQLNWGAVITVTKKPVDFKFDDLTQELTIFLYPEEELPLDSDELGYIVIDRTGNAR